MNVTLDEKALKYIHHFMDMLSSAFRLTLTWGSRCRMSSLNSIPELQARASRVHRTNYQKQQARQINSRAFGPWGSVVEATGGFEPPNRGFAVP